MKVLIATLLTLSGHLAFSGETNTVNDLLKDACQYPGYCQSNPEDSCCSSPMSEAKHNMILLGEAEVFASHIIYKEPHNYQVILQLNFNSEDQRAYLDAKKANPNSLFFLTLDHMDISKISTSQAISGSIYFEDPGAQKHLLIPKVILAKNEYRVLYFDKLPLSLKRN